MFIYTQIIGKPYTKLYVYDMNAIFISQNLTGVWKSEIAKINIFIHWGIVNGGNKNRCKIADVKKQ